MSSFKNAQKANQRQHRERAQPAARANYGLLEKKKDYKQRATDHQKKQNTLTALKRKALDKNPDEFYFKMVKTKMEDGVHQSEAVVPEYTDEQLKLMQTQDLKYINYRRSLEHNKIEKMKSTLHMLDDVADKPKNKHIVFVDSKKQAKQFDAAKYFDTHPALVGRTFNRPRMETLKKSSLPEVDDKTLAEMTVERRKKYSELSSRIDREKQLHIVAQKMEMKRHLMDKKAKKKKIKGATKDSAPIYKWVAQRKK